MLSQLLHFIADIILGSAEESVEMRNLIADFIEAHAELFALDIDNEMAELDRRVAESDRISTFLVDTRTDREW